MAMKKKKRKTETPTEMEGYLTAIMVWPLNKATRVTAKQNPRIASYMGTRPQKKSRVNPLRGSSLDWMGFPEAMERMFWIK